MPPLRSFLRGIPKKSGYQRLPEDIFLDSYVKSAETKGGGLRAPQSLAQRLRAVAAHTAPYDEESVSRFFHEPESSAYVRREPS
jgi:hypothetical protein